MNPNNEELINKIIAHNYFQKLKLVIENNPWHDQEDAYSHSLKVYHTAKEQINGEFIQILPQNRISKVIFPDKLENINVQI